MPNNLKNMLSYIKDLNISTIYDDKNDKLQLVISFSLKQKVNELWYKAFDKYFNSADPSKFHLILLCDLLNIYNKKKMSEINIKRDTLKIGECSVNLQQLELILEQDTSISISVPNIKSIFPKKLLEYFNLKKEEDFLNEYMNNNIDNIVVFPSDFTSEIVFYKNLEKTKNVLSIMNCKSNEDMSEIVSIDQLTKEILDDYYCANSEYIDKYYRDGNKLVLNFSNDKAITIYDTNYIKENKVFFNEIQNDLIDIKMKEIEKKGKVLKYGKN